MIREVCRVVWLEVVGWVVCVGVFKGRFCRILEGSDLM